jgi:hypothetical protein
MRTISIFILVCGCILGAGGIAPAAQDVGYDSGGRPNPFVPWVTADGRLQMLTSEPKKQEAHQGLSVEGIIYDKRGLSYAVINDEIVKIGDTIDGYQVLRIEESKVIVIRDGQQQEIELQEEGL